MDREEILVLLLGSDPEWDLGINRHPSAFDIATTLAGLPIEGIQVEGCELVITFTVPPTAKQVMAKQVFDRACQMNAHGVSVGAIIDRAKIRW